MRRTRILSLSYQFHDYTSKGITTYILYGMYSFCIIELLLKICNYVFYEILINFHFSDFFLYLYYTKCNKIEAQILVCFNYIRKKQIKLCYWICFLVKIFVAFDINKKYLVLRERTYSPYSTISVNTQHLDNSIKMRNWTT